jgi:hypothetical protein
VIPFFGYGASAERWPRSCRSANNDPLSAVDNCLPLINLPDP